MEMRRLGSSDLDVSVVGLGCNNFGWTIDREQSALVIEKALDVGVTLFDTADYYGRPVGNSEAVLGDVLGARRKDVTLVTKFGIAIRDDAPEPGPRKRNASPGYVMEAVENSLRRLKTDYIDVYMLHWPDAQTPIEDTLRALDRLIADGKVRYIACSNLPAWQVVEAQWTARMNGLQPFIFVQDEFSMLERGVEKAMLPMARQYGLGFLPYFPLAGGLLSGKYSAQGETREATRLSTNFVSLGDKFLNEANLRKVHALDAFARGHGRTLLELAISWLVTTPPVSCVIAGATKPSQIESNAKAAAWKITEDERAEIAQILA